MRNGNFVVTWSGVGPNSNAQTDPSDVFARQFNATGQAIGNQFQVDQCVAGVQYPGVQDQSRVAMAPDGTFVITLDQFPHQHQQSDRGERRNLRPGIHVPPTWPCSATRSRSAHFALRPDPLGRGDGRQ